MTSTAPAQPTAADALAGTSNEGLLTTYRALTHRIDNARQQEARAASDRGEARWAARAADLTAQRDIVHAEVLRRMGGDQ